MTWLVATVACETHIAPSELLGPLDDEMREHMLGAMVSYLRWRAAQQKKGRRRG